VLFLSFGGSHVRGDGVTTNAEASQQQQQEQREEGSSMLVLFVLLLATPMVWILGSKAMVSLKQYPPVLKRTLVTYHPSAPFKSTRQNSSSKAKSKQEGFH